LSVTAEWRHGTITRTFLVMPRRERVLIAKGVSSVLVGAAAAVVGVALALAVAVPWIRAEGFSYELDGVPGLIGRIVLAAALWGAFGVGVGALIRNQTGAIVAGILWVLVVENLLNLLLRVLDLDRVGDFLPGTALAALEGSVDDGLSAWGGAAIAVAWIAALNAIGAQRVASADLT
jgi:ABC-2 type transport system permease protein